MPGTRRPRNCRTSDRELRKITLHFSIVFPNCIFQLYFSTVFLYCIFQLCIICIVYCCTCAIQGALGHLYSVFNITSCNIFSPFHQLQYFFSFSLAALQHFFNFFTSCNIFFLLFTSCNMASSKVNKLDLPPSMGLDFWQGGTECQCLSPSHIHVSHINIQFITLVEEGEKKKSRTVSSLLRLQMNWHWFTGSSVDCSLTHWLIVCWFIGSLFHWFTKSLVHWFTASLVHWFTVHIQCGALHCHYAFVHCECAALVHCGSIHCAVCLFTLCSLPLFTVCSVPFFTMQCVPFYTVQFAFVQCRVCLYSPCSVPLFTVQFAFVHCVVCFLHCEVLYFAFVHYALSKTRGLSQLTRC